MFDDLKHLKTLLLRPTYFFERVGEQSISELFKYWAQVGLIFALEVMIMGFIGLGEYKKIIGFLNIASESFGPAAPVILAIISYLSTLFLGFTSLIISAGMTHLIAMIFGCRGYGKTLTAIVLGSTPSVILGGLPIVKYLAGLYVLILQIIGLSKLHKISIGKSLVIVLLPIIILVLFSLVLIGGLIFGLLRVLV